MVHHLPLVSFLPLDWPLQKLIFLHPFHHSTVLLYCWYSYAFPSNVGMHFVAMNYAEHALMYGYFFLSAIGAWPRWLPPSIITLGQIAQVIIQLLGQNLDGWAAETT